MATKTEHDCSYEIVQQILESGGDTYVLRYAERVLGRPLNIKDFIHNVRMFHALLNNKSPEMALRKLKSERSWKSSKKNPCVKVEDYFAYSNAPLISVDSDVGEDDTETVPFVTEVVGSIAQGLFHKIVATTEVRATDRISSPNNKSSEYRVHEDDPKIITWGKPWNEYPGYYQAVFLDGDEYRVSPVLRMPRRNEPFL